MDEYGLPVLGPSVDYNKAAPIDGKALQTMVNEYLIQSTSFLNGFSSRCELELAKIEANLQRIDTNLLILENKLESIGDTGPVPAADQQPVPPSSGNDIQTEKVTAAPGGQTAIPPPAPAAAEPEKAAPAAPPAAAIIPVSRDPAFARYFKMLQFGVLPQAVKGKMAAEGISPDILDNPNAPTPNGLTESDLEAALRAENEDDDADSDDD